MATNRSAAINRVLLATASIDWLPLVLATVNFTGGNNCDWCRNEVSSKLSQVLAQAYVNYHTPWPFQLCLGQRQRRRSTLRCWRLGRWRWCERAEAWDCRLWGPPTQRSRPASGGQGTASTCVRLGPCPAAAGGTAAARRGGSAQPSSVCSPAPPLQLQYQHSLCIYTCFQIELLQRNAKENTTQLSLTRWSSNSRRTIAYRLPYFLYTMALFFRLFGAGARLPKYMGDITS